MFLSIAFQVSYYRDTYAEHPEDRENIEYRVHLQDDDSLTTLSGTYLIKLPIVTVRNSSFYILLQLLPCACTAGLYNQMQALGYELDYARLPIVDEKAPKEKDFDAMIQVMREQDTAETACVFNCQVMYLHNCI